MGGNTNIGKPFSRINSAYSDEFEDADPSSLSRDHTTCEAKDGVIPAVGVDVVNGHGAEVADMSYYCPMECEGEKTYAELGSCPVCGMDLVEKN